MTMDYKLKILYVEINVYVKLPLIVPVDINLCYPPMLQLHCRGTSMQRPRDNCIRQFDLKCVLSPYQC